MTAGDPMVQEVEADLARRVLTRDVDALERSLRLRSLEGAWKRRTTDADGFTWAPTIGAAWGVWLGALADRGLDVSPVVALLSDAGVLGGRWNDDARAAVFAARGWR
jgi:hypothetical protein